jgi:hypothetical protein
VHFQGSPDELPGSVFSSVSRLSWFIKLTCFEARVTACSHICKIFYKMIFENEALRKALPRKYMWIGTSSFSSSESIENGLAASLIVRFVNRAASIILRMIRDKLRRQPCVCARRIELLRANSSLSDTKFVGRQRGGTPLAFNR